MTLSLAIAGWALATALAVQGARLAWRLELVARAEHELRGPVSALLLAVEALGRRPEQRRRAAALESHLDRLRLGLADLEAARSGRRAGARPAEVSVEGVARAVAEGWEPAARERGGEITFEWQAGPVIAHTDRARLSQAIGNVVANAVEHGGERIAVSGERHGTGVTIGVRDEGRSRTPSAPGARPPSAGDPPDRSRQRRRPKRTVRGRGLTIAARALDDMRASLEAPSLGRVLARPRRRVLPASAIGGTSRSERPGPGQEPGDRPAAGATEVRIELPLLEDPAP